MNKILSTPLKSRWLQWLEQDLLQLDDCQIECNGMSWSVSYLLDQAGIEHECMLGFVIDEFSGQAVTPHYWIKLEDDWIIDYRLRMWLGDTDDVPHGVFHKADAWWLHIRYEGKSVPRDSTEFSREFLINITDGKISNVLLTPKPNNVIYGRF